MSLTKASYSMITGAVANVLDFGADPTGVADSTSAIQAAINVNGAVFLPKGTYRTTATLTLANKTQLFGEGFSSVLNYTGAGDAIYSTSGGLGNNYKTISQLYILATNSNTAIRIVDEYHTYINNVYIWGNYTGCRLAGIIIEGTGFNNCGVISIIESTIQTCVGHGVRFTSTNFGPGAIYIAGTRIQANNGWGIFADQDQSVEATIIGNDIEGNVLGGIYIVYPFCTNIIGNHFEIVSAQPALQLGGAGAVGRVYNSTITGNNCSTAGNAYCVYLNNFQSSNLSSNYFTGFTSAAVSSTGSTANALLQTNTTTSLDNLTVSTGDLKVTAGNFISNVSSSAPTLSTNSTLSFQRVSDTSLKILMRGNDGTTRSATLTLS
jgi:hypothetical protein